MQYTVSVGEKSTRIIEVTFDEQEFAEAIDEAYRQTRGKYSLPGFRKGKVPKSMLINYYGEGLFYEDAINLLFSKHYPEIAEKEKENFEIVGDPRGEIEDVSHEKVVLSITVDVMPQVELGPYTGLKIQKYEFKVTDEQVENEMISLSARDHKLVPILDRAARMGDNVNIDFEGKKDGVAFPGGTAEDYTLVLGSGSFIPGFEDEIVGLETGESKTFEITFPEDYGAEDLAGQKAEFTVKVNEIKQSERPEIDEEYAKKYGGCDSVEALKEKTRGRLEERAIKDSRDQTENSIMNAIVAGCKCDIPETLIKDDMNQTVQKFSYSLSMQGLTLDEYIKYMQMTKEQFTEQFRPTAEKNVLSQLTLRAIIDKEGIGVRPGQLDEKITEQAQSIGKTYEEYKQTIDPRQVEYITNDIIVTNLFEFLTSNNELYLEEDKKSEEKSEE